MRESCELRTADCAPEDALTLSVSEAKEFVWAPDITATSAWWVPAMMLPVLVNAPEFWR